MGVSGCACVGGWRKEDGEGEGEREGERESVCVCVMSGRNNIEQVHWNSNIH